MEPSIPPSNWVQAPSQRRATLADLSKEFQKGHVKVKPRYDLLAILIIYTMVRIVANLFATDFDFFSGVRPVITGLGTYCFVSPWSQYSPKLRLHVGSLLLTRLRIMHLSLPLLLVQNFLFIGESIYVKNGKSPAGQGEVTCAALSNQELFSSVKVSIGDPAQTFDLVADTGSDTCIVKDCSCTQCPAEWGSCFNGRELSKSFKLPTSEARWLQL